MKKTQEIFAKYCSNQYLIEHYDEFVSYETNANNEVISLTIFDSDYHGDFPFINNIGNFISEFKQLKELEIELFGQVIPTFQPLFVLKELETIHIESNTQINDLSFVKDMKNLKRIYLENSDIQSIKEFKNTKKLNSIALPNAQIHDISPLQDLSELTFINFNNNQIEKIDSLRHCHKLQYIHLNSNRIVSINALQSLYELTTVYISNNNIDNLNPLRYLNKISSLEASDNKISAIDFLDNFKQLFRLNIANNFITNINNIKACTQLSYLNISDNSIENIDFLKGKQSLKELNISNNPIHSVDILSSLKSLQTLFASHINFQIKDDFEFDAKLLKLDLSHCQLTNIDFLFNQKQVIRLNLSNNQISNIDGLECLTELQSLNLQNNQITEVIPFQFVKLVAIDLRGNEFGNLLFGHFTHSYYSSTVHYTDIFQPSEEEEKESLNRFKQVIADEYLKNGENEVALAAYYFDASGHNSTINRDFLDIRLYLLKHLVNRKSPFVYNIQQKLLRTIESQFSYSDLDKRLREDYLDKILNIEERNIKLRMISANRFSYFFQNHLEENQSELSTTLEELIAEEKALFNGLIIQPTQKRKRYERKTSANDSSEFAGCIVWLILMIFLAVLIFADLVPRGVLQGMVFFMSIVKIAQHLYYKHS